MVHISEWLPNPDGSDTQGEWLELFNDGAKPVGLSGWSIKTGNGKTTALSGSIAPGEYKIFQKTTFKFTLRNSEESLSLLDPTGHIVDASSYHGQAPSGQSVNHAGALSFFSKPTPAAANSLAATSLIDHKYPLGVSLAAHPGYATFLGMLFGTALTLSVMVVFIFRNHNGLSELFFGQY